ncbi:hypothetical protein BD410DRAFT_94477 [Rickenella mellea]|uniref:Uncharacterized protein n=1 Tax=Rickenella mellea TaxID=50990 RepID=A0A4Y7QAT8_9AGAM|nr:hypothetical protein BD410DRAFT_94477 [Rickenella mellea]
MMDDPGEEERVRAAVSMTLCELATARHHSTPLECSPFFLDSENLVSGPSHLSNCVDALSRSAQHWSSYSGYMREIPQLCSSLRRWNDLDAAKSLYKNATLEKLALLRLLFNREKRQEELIERWETHLEDSLTICSLRLK